MNFIGNFFLFPVWKNFENRFRFDEVTTMSLVAPFFGTQCMCSESEVTIIFYGCFSFFFLSPHLNSMRRASVTVQSMCNSNRMFCSVMIVFKTEQRFCLVTNWQHHIILDMWRRWYACTCHTDWDSEPCNSLHKESLRCCRLQASLAEEWSVSVCQSWSLQIKKRRKRKGDGQICGKVDVNT